MQSSLKGVMYYCSISFVAIVGLAAWPFNSDQLLVILPSQASHSSLVGHQGTSQAIFKTLAGTNATLVEQLTSQSYIVSVSTAADHKIIERLYQNGAFLVLNAAGFAGCGEQKPQQALRREIP